MFMKTESELSYISTAELMVSVRICDYGVFISYISNTSNFKHNEMIFGSSCLQYCTQMICVIFVPYAYLYPIVSQ